MRVESVEAIAIEIPLAKDFGGSTYSVLKRSTVITRMRTDGGLVSEVYVGEVLDDAVPPVQRRVEHDLGAGPATRGLAPAPPVLPACR